MNRSIWSIVSRLRKPDDPSSDAMVLSRYVQYRDANAFELLVWRHGSFVLSVCKRILADEHAAEDAFQATFFILARKAPSIRGSLVGWLHLVAKRVSLRLKRKTKKTVAVFEEEMAVESTEAVFPGELARVIDEEIGRLPEKLRLPVILCYLQGRSTEEVAQTLGIPRGTVLSRLHHAKQRLQDLLQHRGIVAPATFLASAVALPSLSADFCRSLTSEAIMFFNTSVATTVPTQLAQEFLVMATRKTVFGMAAAMVLTAGLGTGVSFVLAQGDGKKPAPAGNAVTAVNRIRDDVKPTATESVSNSMEQLKKKRELLTNKFNTIDKAIQILNHENQNKSDDLPVNILEQMLAKIENQLVESKLTSIAMLNDIRVIQKSDLEAAMAGKLEDQDKLQLYQNEISLRINERMEVKKFHQDYQDAIVAVNTLSKNISTESAMYQNIHKELNAKKQAYEKVRESVLPAVRNAYYTEMLSSIQREIANDRQRRELMELSLKSLIETRMNLVSKINKAKDIERDKKLVDDEIEILREVRKQLYKERLLTEMALDEMKN